jgi:hypothetical protein
VCALGSEYKKRLPALWFREVDEWAIVETVQDVCSGGHVCRRPYGSADMCLPRICSAPSALGKVFAPPPAFYEMPTGRGIRCIGFLCM